MARKTYKIVVEFSDGGEERVDSGVTLKAAYNWVEKAQRLTGDPYPIGAKVFEDDGNGRGYGLYERISFVEG